jgi:AraC-like DNA-binding protein
VGNMSGIVFSMLDGGWTDERICAELGMSVDELLRLKHMTGFSKLFENVEYRRAWETRRQLEIRRAYRAEHPDEETPI